MKSEPDVFSIQDLKKKKTTDWDGVRNYQARNYMRDQMKKGDLVFFYHSNAEPSGIAGIARVCKESHPDKSQFDKKSEYYDEKASKEKPNWFCVQVRFEKKFPQLISLQQLRDETALSEMLVLKKGQRLSIQPVDEKDFLHIVKMAL